MVGYSITRKGANEVSLSLASTLVTEFLRSRALAAAGDKSLGTYDPDLQVVPDLVSRTETDFTLGRIATPDLTVGRIPDMTRRYLIDFSTRTATLKGRWEGLLGEHLSVVETIAANLTTPTGLAVASDGAIYIADLGNYAIRKLVINPVNPTSATISRVVGTYNIRKPNDPVIDGSTARDSKIGNPSALCFDTAGNLYVSEFGAHHIVRISSDGKLYNFAGSGSDGAAGDDGPALLAAIGYPSALAYDPRKNRILVGNWQSPRIRAIDLATNIITTLAGGGQSGEDAVATAVSLSDIGGVVMEPNGNLLFSDSQSARVRRLWLTEPKD